MVLVDKADGAVRVQHEHGRDVAQAQLIRQAAVPVHEHRDRHSPLAADLLKLIRPGAVNADGHEPEANPLLLRRQLAKLGELLDPGVAPEGEEVEHHHRLL